MNEFGPEFDWLRAALDRQNAAAKSICRLQDSYRYSPTRQFVCGRQTRNAAAHDDDRLLHGFSH